MEKVKKSQIFFKVVFRQNSLSLPSQPFENVLHIDKDLMKMFGNIRAEKCKQVFVLGFLLSSAINSKTIQLLKKSLWNTYMKSSIIFKKRLS